jgi:hypothetical protein
MDTNRKHGEVEGKTFVVRQVEQSGDAASGYCLAPGQAAPPTPQ